MTVAVFIGPAFPTSRFLLFFIGSPYLNDFLDRLPLSVYDYVFEWLTGYSPDH